MFTLRDICKICLRTNRTLTVVDNTTLLEFHAELTKYSLDLSDTRLCSECYNQLKKTYNFKQKCIMAADILLKWSTSKVTERKPVCDLHTLLPTNPLKISRASDDNIFTYNWKEQDFTENTEFQESINDENIYKEIKLEKDSDSDSQDICLKDLLKLKNEGNLFQEVFIQNLDSCQIKKPETIDTDDVESNERNVLEIGDDASLNSADDYEFGDEVTVKRKKRSLVELGNISLTSDDYDTVSSKKPLYNSSKSHIITIEKNIVSKLKHINADLDSIHDSWQKTSMKLLPEYIDKDKRSLTKKVDKEELKRLKQKGVLTQLVGLKADLDMIHDNCTKIINYKEGLQNPKERLKAELTDKFAACGELVTEKGYVIDKQTIMNCFDRVSECLMRRLWRFVHDKDTLSPMAVRLLKHIQMKYQDEFQYETVFDIEYLNTEDKVIDEFNNKRKTYEWYINSKYKCEKCSLGFKYEAQLEHHTNSHEESAGAFPCPVCGVRHKSKKSLTSHSKSHEAVYKCKLCPLVTYYRGSMQNHYHQHQGMQYKCDICGTTFKSKSARQTHIGIYHRDAKDGETEVSTTTEGARYSCSACSLAFDTLAARRTHMRDAHHDKFNGLKRVKTERPRKKPIFDCRVCNATGTSMGWLMTHLRSEHPAADSELLYADKRRHLCHVCGKGFANVYNMRDHLNLHAGLRPHVCWCGARFHRSYALAQHRRTHAPPARPCQRCGKRFRSQSNLANHMRSHIGDRRYKCNLCGKGFLHRNALNEHVRGVHHKMRRVRRRGGEGGKTQCDNNGGVEDNNCEGAT